MNLGQKAHKARSDTNSYCAFELGAEMSKDILDEVQTCIQKHHDYFDSDEFCVVMLMAGDPLLKNMIRRKFYAWPFLPKPRTSQTVWLYNKKSGNIKMLWCLPSADTVATLSILVAVDPSYKRMQRWSSWFYTTRFWKNIRSEHDIKMLSEEEHLEVIRKKGSKFCGEDCSPIPTNPVDSLKFQAQEV